MKGCPHFLVASTHCKTIASQKSFRELLLRRNRKQCSKIHDEYQTVTLIPTSVSRNWRSNSIIQQRKGVVGRGLQFRFISFHPVAIPGFGACSRPPLFYFLFVFTIIVLLTWTQTEGVSKRGLGTKLTVYHIAVNFWGSKCSLIAILKILLK